MFDLELERSELVVLDGVADVDGSPRLDGIEELRLPESDGTDRFGGGSVDEVKFDVLTVASDKSAGARITD